MATTPPSISAPVTFTGSHGEGLAGRLDLPESPAKAFALFAHCFTCSKDLRAAGLMAKKLNEHGIGVLRFDFTGLGHSDGEFANTNFSSNVNDLKLAADWLRQNHAAPQVLVGHSLGGAAVLAAAGDLPEVRAVATIGAPSSTEHLTHLFVDELDAINGDGAAEVCIAGRSFTIRRDFVTDLAAHSIQAKTAELNRALLVLHSPIDQVVGIDHAAALYTAARHPKSFVSLDGADHLLTRPADAKFAATIVATWAERYLSA